MTAHTPPATAPVLRQVHVRPAALLRRWPTLLALALATLLLADLGDGTENALLLLVTAVTYLVLAVGGRPTTTWPVLLAALIAVVVLQSLGTLGTVLIGTTLVVLAVTGLMTGALRGDGLQIAQAPAAVVVAGAGLVATSVDARVGVVIVAAGLIVHAGWDAVHWRRNRVVQRSFAEWCGVLDLTVGIGLLVLV